MERKDRLGARPIIIIQIGVAEMLGIPRAIRSDGIAEFRNLFVNDSNLPWIELSYDGLIDC